MEIVNENMHAALRVVSVERGHDQELRARRVRRGRPDARERPGASDPVPLRDRPTDPRRDERLRVPLFRHPERVPGDVPASPRRPGHRS